MALDKQMDLFQEGGMIDEGGTTDPVSGNDVPVGSLQEEVRDDIPAQLSEGEFVMPADVVRYHGLDKMMALRDEAKMGLQRMEAMGQMGNADEATLPSDVPFGLEDLDIAEDPREMQVGGFVPAAPQFTPGGVQQSQFQNYAPQFTPYQMPQYTTPDFSAYQPPQQAFTPMAPTQAPPFTQFVRPKTVTYVDANGNEIQVPVGEDGTPLIPVPPGYSPKADMPTTPDPAPDTTPQQQPVTTQQKEEDPSDGREFGGGPAGLSITESKVSVLKQLDPKFAQIMSGIDEKYKAPAGLGGFSILGGIGREFKRGSETRKAIKDYDYETLAQQVGLTVEETKDVVNELAGETYTGYRDAVTGEVSGQKDLRSLSQIIQDKMDPKTYEDIDEFGNIADDGTMPTTTGVETARVTETGTAADIAAEQAAAQAAAGKITEGFPTRISSAQNRRNDLVAQTYESLVARNVPGDLALTAAKQAVDEGTVNAEVASLFGDIGSALTDAATAGSTLGRATKPTEGVAASIRRSQQTKPTKPEKDTRMSPGAMGGRLPPAAVDPETDILPGEPGSDIAPTLNREEVDRQTQNYRNKGYSVSNAKKAARNKVAADNAAKQQRRDRGETEANIAKTSAVTDSNGNAVTSGSDGSIVTSGPQTEDPGPSKIVCTEMYRQTQLDDWKQAIKIWGVYEKKYLTPYHEKGYHWLFMPWVNGMRRSTTLTSIGAYLAMARTQHLKHVMTKGKAPDSIVGNVWCKIVHPIVYIAGRTKEWLKL